jgi:hypothetical protein
MTVKKYKHYIKKSASTKNCRCLKSQQVQSVECSNVGKGQLVKKGKIWSHQVLFYAKLHSSVTHAFANFLTHSAPSEIASQFPPPLTFEKYTNT